MEAEAALHLSKPVLAWFTGTTTKPVCLTPAPLRLFLSRVSMSPCCGEESQLYQDLFAGQFLPSNSSLASVWVSAVMLFLTLWVSQSFTTTNISFLLGFLFSFWENGKTWGKWENMGKFSAVVDVLPSCLKRKIKQNKLFPKSNRFPSNTIIIRVPGWQLLNMQPWLCARLHLGRNQGSKLELRRLPLTQEVLNVVVVDDGRLWASAFWGTFEISRYPASGRRQGVSVMC